MSGLDFLDEPLPEAKRLGMWIVDTENIDAARHPKKDNVAQSAIKPFGIV